MRRRKSILPYIQLFAVFLAMMSIPRDSSLRIKGMTMAMMAPAWEQLHSIKKALTHVTDIKITGDDGREAYAKEEIQRLKSENLLLANERNRLREILQNEAFIQGQIALLKNSGAKEGLNYLNRFREDNFKALLSLQLLSVPAEVIYRSPSAWTNTLWINVGAKDNEGLCREVIAKNSPIVVGTSVAGVIDYVGNRQSRVRLITDPGLVPSVRVMRIDGDKTWYMAKGEIRGSKEAMWRGLSPVLKGIGFNYDFPDDEGPARDLRTGDIVGDSSKQEKIPIIQKGDLLITTGMDGVFPYGLQVAHVSHINLLKEGDYFYEIEATSCIKNLDDLTTVFVLPPTGYDPSIQAPPIIPK